MAARIKMIWDFRGPDSLKYAQHHAIHLQQFCTRENLQDIETGSEGFGEMHSIAFMVIPESLKLIIRDALKPNRAVIA